MIRLILVLVVVFSSLASQARTWKAVFVSGDDSIPNFDRGREEMARALLERGQVEAVHFTSNQTLVSPSLAMATQNNIAHGFSRMNIQGDQGCLVHMTSHGSFMGGFYLSGDRPLSPWTLAQWVNATCGDHPTVVLVSACYSGQFVIPELQGPNRIIMTAARNDRTSFGCSADTEYTFWDGCILSTIPQSRTWQELHQNVVTCIQRKEERRLGLTSSHPQAYFGANTANWNIVD